MTVSVSAGLTKQKARWMYEKMCEIRQFEDRVHDIFQTGVLPGFVHLYAGQEAVAVGVCAHLNESDSITSTHRGHGHCIAKECDLHAMMAEIYGKATGLCKGKGGSMHIADVEKGMLGANGIVGGGFPLAVGAALTAKIKKTDAVAVCFLVMAQTITGLSMRGSTLPPFGNCRSSLSPKIMVTRKLPHSIMRLAAPISRIEQKLTISPDKLWMEKM